MEGSKSFVEWRRRDLACRHTICARAHTTLGFSQLFRFLLVSSRARVSQRERQQRLCVDIFHVPVNRQSKWKELCGLNPAGRRRQTETSSNAQSLTSVISFLGSVSTFELLTIFRGHRVLDLLRFFPRTGSGLTQADHIRLVCKSHGDGCAF